MGAPPIPPTSDQVAQKLASLKLSLDPEINYALDSMFPKIEGWFANGPVKKKAKLIHLLEPTLIELLKPNERVLFVAKGVQHSFVESMFMGAMWAAMLNQMAFVLTSDRVLMIRTDTRGNPKHQFWVIYYSEVDDIKTSWTGAVQLKLLDGKKPSFGGFPKADRAAMKAVFDTVLREHEESGYTPDASQSMETLCCHCYDAVPEQSFACVTCGTTFWKPMELSLRSLLFPSWGDVLMKHYLFASMEMFGYLIGLTIVIIMLTNSDGPDELIGGIAALAIFLLFAHGVDAMLTYMVGRKGLYPRTAPTKQIEQLD